MIPDPPEPLPPGGERPPRSRLSRLYGPRFGRIRRAGPSADAVPAPQVRLGTVQPGGLSPAILAIVERGVRRRPVAAGELQAEIELRLGAAYPPVRIVFTEQLVLVEDGPAVAPDVRVEGELTDLIALMVTPLLGGLPNPIDARGRSALGKMAVGRLRVEGRLAPLRRLLGVIRI